MIRKMFFFFSYFISNTHIKRVALVRIFEAAQQKICIRLPWNTQYITMILCLTQLNQGWHCRSLSLLFQMSAFTMGQWQYTKAFTIYHHASISISYMTNRNNLAHHNSRSKWSGETNKNPSWATSQQTNVEADALTKPPNS